MKTWKTNFRERDRYEQGILTVGEGLVQLTILLTSLDQLLFNWNIIYFFYKRSCLN